MNYKNYLESEHWRGFRLEVLHYWKGECGLCKQPAKDVHHRHYLSLWEEDIKDCIPLCRSCHIKQHKTLSDIAEESLILAKNRILTLSKMRSEAYQLDQETGENWRSPEIHKDIVKMKKVVEILITFCK